MPADKSAVVKLQLPLLLAVVVPSALVPPSDTVTVDTGRRGSRQGHRVVGIDRAAADGRCGRGGASPSHRTDSTPRWSPPKSCRWR